MTIKETITVQDAIDLLNSAVEADPEAMRALCEARVSCNQVLADHSAIQVRQLQCGPDEKFEEDDLGYRVGMLGILNGLFGVNDNGYGAIAASYDVDCPSGCKVGDGEVVGGECLSCGATLTLGRLVGFIDLNSKIAINDPR